MLVRRAQSRIDQATLESEIGDWEDARSWDHPSHPLVSDRSPAALLELRRVPGREAVLADSRWEGEVVAGVGRVRRPNILSILWDFLVRYATIGPPKPDSRMGYR